MSYDSLVENMQSKENAYIAYRANEHINLLSTKFVNDKIFVWMNPTTVRLKPELKKDIWESKSQWFHHSIKGGMAMDYIYPNLVTADV